MEKSKNGPEYGNLPEHGLLGIEYVPQQKHDSPKYSKEEGLKNGTLFPGLNLPYGRYIPDADAAKTPAGQMMALSFALDELALYLDVRPNDKEALELRNGYAALYEEAMAAYAREHGPVQKNSVMKDRFQWVQGPWPWE